MSETGAQPGVWIARPFGTTSTGEAVTCYRIENSSGAWVEVLDYGCTLRGIGVPDKRGQITDVLLGYDRIEDYEAGDAYLGAVIGRCAGRIAGAKITLGGKTYPLSANCGDYQLHGGVRGFNRHIWAAKVRGGNLVFRRRSPDGEEGYPGNLEVSVSFAWSNSNTLSMEFTAFADQDTVVSLTNHPYFNLNGAGAGTIDKHTLQVSADEYTELDERNLITGRILQVENTPLDFLRAKPLDIPVDYNFCFSRTGLHSAAQLSSRESGISLEVSTTQPGLQVYTGDFLSGPAGKGGAEYGPRSGVALEAQGWPDAAAWPAFPSNILRQDVPYQQRIEFAFSVRG